MDEKLKVILIYVAMCFLGAGVIGLIIYLIVHFSKSKKPQNTMEPDSNKKNIGENCSLGGDCKSESCANGKCV
jgi:hypothetical protein